MAKAKKKDAEVDLAAILDDTSVFDVEERSVKLSSIGVDSIVRIGDSISTGMLAVDLMIGGGLMRGREYEIVGPEHGGKTTLIYSCFAAAIKHIPNALKALFFDIEGTIDPRWFGNICGEKDLTNVFGKSKETAQGIVWEKKPKIRYYKPNFGEQALKLLKRQLKRMPDKVLIGDTWYYMWTPRDSASAKKTGTAYTLADLRDKLKGAFDKKLFQRYGSFYVKVPNNYSGPELIIGVDSWAAMTPEAIAEDDSNAMASQARMFSKHLNDIKSLIAAKGCTIIGANQIREKMMAYGNPEYSPGGNTKKHTTDCRLRIGTVNNPFGKGALETDGDDEYRHFKIVNRKNKVFQPYKECVGRWWNSHNGETGYGPDPVYDTLQYLKMTGQIVRGKDGKTKGYRIVFDKKKKDKLLLKLEKMVLSPDDFKDAILGPKEFGLDIRKMCFKQLRSGYGMTLYMRNGKKDSLKDED